MIVDRDARGAPRSSASLWRMQSCRCDARFCRARLPVRRRGSCPRHRLPRLRGTATKALGCRRCRAIEQAAGQMAKRQRCWNDGARRTLSALNSASTRVGHPNWPDGCPNSRTRVPDVVTAPLLRAFFATPSESAATAAALTLANPCGTLVDAVRSPLNEVRVRGVAWFGVFRRLAGIRLSACLGVGRMSVAARFRGLILLPGWGVAPRSVLRLPSSSIAVAATRRESQ
jgi:hypothetical protein